MAGASSTDMHRSDGASAYRFLDAAPEARAGVVDEYLHLAEVAPEGIECASDRAGVGDVARVCPGVRQAGGEIAGELGGAGEQRDRISLRGKTTGESRTVARPHADDDTHGFHGRFSFAQGFSLSRTGASSGGYC